jgi:serine protease Do
MWLVAAAASVSSGPLRAHDFADSLVKIRAVAADGSQSFGSGVVIADNLLATACHVTREAKTIEVTHDGKRWVATVESGSATHDLCLISVSNLRLPAIAIRASESLRPGERVVAAGFPSGGDLAVHDGVVEGLYRYDGGNVIRTSATFDAGASGGGLFDEEGALVGLLAFKARSGAKLHFALPADWALPGTMVSSLLGPIAVSTQRNAFWEQPRASQPPFLGHAMLEAASQR